MRKNPFIQFLGWALFFSHPALAQEAIQIEIDSAPVQVEIPKPAEPAKQPEPTAPPQAEKTQPEPEQEKTEKAEKGDHNYAVAIGVGALVAGLLAALAGGGGGSGGGGSTPQH